MKFFIALLFIVFLTSITTLSAMNTITGSLNSTSNLEVLPNLPCKDHGTDPKKAKVILRIDNVQGYAFRDTAITMAEDAKKQGITPTLGVISENLESDTKLVEYLKDNRCNLEVAQQLTATDSATILDQKADLEKQLETIVKTAIPVSDTATDALYPALRYAGYDFLSQKKSLTVDSVNAETFNPKTNSLIPVSDVIDTCKAQLLKKDLCIVSVHPQYYQTQNLTDSTIYHDYYTKLLQELSALPVEFITYTDLPKEIGLLETSTISGWIGSFDQGLAIKSLENPNINLQTVSPVLYDLNEKGEIKPVVTGYSQNQLKNVLATKEISVIPSITNGFDPKRTTTFLADTKAQDREITKLVELAQKQNYQGFDIDWEQIDPQDKDKFTHFMQKLSQAFSTNKLKLTIAVHAKTGTSTDWSAATSQDWQALGKIVDEFRIMAYDFHSENSAPGPIAPKAAVEKVLDYALNVVPRHKIVLGLPTYGYDWNLEKGSPVQFNEVGPIYQKYEMMPDRDLESGELSFFYRDEAGTPHQIWFSDATSIHQKIAIAQKKGVNKFILWRLGGEDSAIWEE